MNTTTKNWLTTVLFAGLGGFAMYLLAHMPDGDAGWGPWRVALIAAVCSGVVLAAGAYHSYRPQSGQGGDGDGDVGGGSGGRISGERKTPPNAARLRLTMPMLLLLSLSGCANGQLNPQVLNVGTLTIKTLACTLDVYTRDSVSQPINWVAMALDLAATCGMDVAAIVNAFGPDSPVSKAAVANAEGVNLAAARFAAKAAK
jgi:hypothetical protein